MTMFRCCLPLLFLFASLLHLHAQQAPVVVSNVKFNSKISPYDWNDMEIKLRAQVNPDENAVNKNYVDNVGVRVTLGYMTDRREKTFYFLQTEVTIATMEIGKEAMFAFWIPYDIVKRGNFNREPDYWVIELTVDGQAVNMATENTSRNISNRKELDSFMNAASKDVGKTEGILLPDYLSPYLPFVTNPPAFIRKEPK